MAVRPRAVGAHLFASAVVFVSVVAGTVGVYLALFVLGVLTGAPLGSPIALPLWTLLAAGFSLFMLPANWIPATVIAARWSPHAIVRIPIAMGISLVLSLAAGTLLLDEELFDAGVWTLALFAWLPLGLYFWAHWSSDAILESVARVTGRCRE